MLLVVLQPFVHLVHYFSFCLLVLGGTQNFLQHAVGEIDFLCRYFQVISINILMFSESKGLGVPQQCGFAFALVYFQE